jgi:hypothetical protein
MGKTFKDRAKWERKNNDRFREQRAQLPRFDDRMYREQTQTPRRETSPPASANTAAA